MGRSLKEWCLSVYEKKGCSKRHVLLERGSPPTPPADVVAIQCDRLRARGDSPAGRSTIGRPTRVSRRGVACRGPCALRCTVYLRPAAVLPSPLCSLAGFSPFNGNGHRFIGFFLLTVSTGLVWCVRVCRRWWLRNKHFNNNNTHTHTHTQKERAKKRGRRIAKTGFFFFNGSEQLEFNISSLTVFLHCVHWRAVQ